MFLFEGRNVHNSFRRCARNLFEQHKVYFSWLQNRKQKKKVRSSRPNTFEGGLFSPKLSFRCSPPCKTQLKVWWFKTKRNQTVLRSNKINSWCIEKAGRETCNILKPLFNISRFVVLCSQIIHNQVFEKKLKLNKITVCSFEFKFVSFSPNLLAFLRSWIIRVTFYFYLLTGPTCGS
jgi:hypothetical protein